MVERENRNERMQEFARMAANEAITAGEFHNVPEERYAKALQEVADEFAEKGYAMLQADDFEVIEYHE